MTQKTAPSPIESGHELPARDAVMSPADPSSLRPEQLARLLGLSEEKVQSHLQAGAPTGAAGTINLVQYVAWLNQHLKERDGE